MDLAVDADSDRVTVTGRLEGEDLRPQSYLTETSGASAQFVIRLEGAETSLASKHIPVASPLVTGITLRQEGGVLTVLIDCPGALESPPVFRRDSAGFSLSVSAPPR